MAIIDRVAYEPEKFGQVRDENLLIWRWPSDSLTLGTQLIVGESQEAIFFKGGQAVDTFGPGTHTLATDNLPLLDKLINLPFGGQTPFTAEVYFVNRHSKLDVKWGTADPFRITDPVYKIIVPIRSFGQIGLSVADSRSFLVRLVGTSHQWNFEQLESYFRGLVVMKVKDGISAYMQTKEISSFDMSRHLSEVSDVIRYEISLEFMRFGVEVVNFFVMSISIPDNDPSLLKIQDAMASRAEIEALGANYRLKRTFDAMDKAAANEGGVAGVLFAGGLGASLSTSLIQSDVLGANAQAVPDSMAGRLTTLKDLLERNLITEDEFAAKRNEIIGKI